MLSRAQRTPFGEWWWTVDRLTLAAIGALMLAGVVFLSPQVRRSPRAWALTRSTLSIGTSFISCPPSP